jgi:hypothetical protein
MTSPKEFNRKALLQQVLFVELTTPFNLTF